MPREITDEDGKAWTCIQAFAGLDQDSDHGSTKAEAARVAGSEDRFHVVCTPSGGAHSVRVELPGGWEEGVPDAELRGAVRARLGEDS